jgi:hypothetical protein
MDVRTKRRKPAREASKPGRTELSEEALKQVSDGGSASAIQVSEITVTKRTDGSRPGLF